MRAMAIVAMLALLCGCALPETRVSTGEAAPGLIVAGAPAGAVLYVDGLPMGAAAQYDGKPKVLAVLEGAHQVEVRQGETVVYSEKAYVGNGETHTVRVAAGTAQ
ncbi:MAG: hypothetical protein JSR36_08935 [Proteobacteria bacterium]|nr:hypothetical protein [Pseudomonadota bacterium]